MKPMNFYLTSILLTVLCVITIPATAEVVFASSFTTLPSNVILRGNAIHETVSGNGLITLTNNTSSKMGTLLLPQPNKPLPSITINFAGWIGSSNSVGGIGMCVAYGPIPDDALFGNDSPYNGLKIRFNTGQGRFQLYYNGAVLINNLVTDGTLRYNALRQFHITVTADGRCSVYQDGYIRAANVQLPGWNPQSNWRVAFGAATSSTTVDYHRVDSIDVITSEPRFLSMTATDSSPVGGSTTQVGYYVDFSEAMLGLDPADFVLTTLSGTPIASIQGSPVPAYQVQESFSGSAGVGTLTGSAAVSTTELQLTTGMDPGSGGWYFQPPAALNSFYCSFRLYCAKYGTFSGEGAWFGYAPNANDYQTINPTTNPGLYVVFDTYKSGTEVAPVVSVRQNGTPRAFSRENIAGNWIDVAIGVDVDGLCTVTVNGREICGDVRLLNWSPQANWYIGLAGFASVNNPYAHFVDDFYLRGARSQVTLTSLGGAGTIRLDLNNATATDMFGALLPTTSFSNAPVYELDFIPPVITLNGTNPVATECNTTYIELGATAQDNRDGDLTGSLIIDNSAVNTAVLGSHNVSYQVSDTVGNTAQVIRVVNVADTIPPSVLLLGAAPLNHECHFPFTDPGAVAIDSCEGVKPVTVTGTVDPNTVGTYTITYTASDSSSNVGQSVRTVNVVDTTAPIMDGPTTLTAECGNYLPLPERNSFDLCAGTLSSTIADLDGLNVTQPAVGEYDVLYTVTDGYNVINSILKVTVEDTWPPLVVVDDTSPFIGECGVPLPFPDAYWYDACLGIGGTATPTIDPIQPVGFYTVSFSATDGTYTTVFPPTGIPVTVLDTQPPVISLNGDDPMTVNCGEVYQEPGATAIDLCEGELTTMEIQSAIPEGPMPPGTWTVTYKARDQYNHESTLTRTVTALNNCTLQLVAVTQSPIEAEFEKHFELKVRAEGAVGPVNYQWYRNLAGTKAWELIPGATNAILVLDPVAWEDAGQYYCEGSDLVTTVQSPVIMITVGWGLPVGGIASLTLLAVGLAALGIRQSRKR